MSVMEDLVKVLRDNGAVGAQNAISVFRLGRILGISSNCKLQDWKAQLIYAGHKIGSCENGYFLIEDEKDLEIACKWLRKKAIEKLELASELEKDLFKDQLKKLAVEMEFGERELVSRHCFTVSQDKELEECVEIVCKRLRRKAIEELELASELEGDSFSDQLKKLEDERDFERNKKAEVGVWNPKKGNGESC